MKGWFRVREIPIAKCVHYDGFRYGRNELNPYENYITGLSRGADIGELRMRFSDFLQHYRPVTLGDALGVATRRPVPLWLLPWKSWRKLFRPGGWQESPVDIPDILTHFSPAGIPLSMLEREYFWLERAWASIESNGYIPERHSYIDVFELRGESDSRFIVVDGNHRLSALAALGHETVVVRQGYLSCARRRLSRFWPLVLSGHVSVDDACTLFDAYFYGGERARSENAAPILQGL
jgi:hypothetical protein